MTSRPGRREVICLRWPTEDPIATAAGDLGLDPLSHAERTLWEVRRFF